MEIGTPLNIHHLQILLYNTVLHHLRPQMSDLDRQFLDSHMLHREALHMENQLELDCPHSELLSPP